MARAYYSDSADAVYKRKRRAENSTYGQRQTTPIVPNAGYPAKPKTPSAGAQATATLLLIGASALIFIFWVLPALKEFGLFGNENNERKQQPGE